MNKIEELEAEIAKHAKNLAHEYGLGRADGEKEHQAELVAQLSAARAEIENQQHQVADLQRLGQELEKKLDALRAAAEDVLDDCYPDQRARLAKAIEASR